MYRKRNIKRERILVLIACIVLVILIILGVFVYKHFNSYEYKLSKIGYSDSEITKILKMDDKVLDKALEGYNEDLLKLCSQKYFMWKNYKVYTSYLKKVKEKSNTIDYKDVVSTVNTKSNYKYYTHTTLTDMSKGNAILVNKYYSLPKEYAPDDIVDVSNWYSYSGIKTRSVTYEAFKEMYNAAKKDGITIIINSGYRSYEAQKKVYNEYKDSKGVEYADSYAARPDFSEHQSGLSLDIITYGASGETFDQTDAFKWLSKNAYKYGFILRYPKGKEDITGYSYESWHYRYLGKKLAKKVYDSGLTYDEYYAYYLDKE